MLAREPYGSWDLARDVHLFRSLERLGIPCVSGLALGRSDGTHPSYAPQRIGGCSSNGCDFPVCFPFPSCHCAFASSNRYRHGMVVRHSGPHLHRYTRHDEWSGHCHVDWDSSVRLRHNANCVHHWILRGVAAGVALRSWRALPRCNQARTDGSSAAATGVRKAAPRLTCPLRVTRVGILTSALCRRSPIADLPRPFAPGRTETAFAAALALAGASRSRPGVVELSSTASATGRAQP